MKWKLFAPKKKTNPRQLNPGNQLLEEITNYKKFVFTTFAIVTLLNSNKLLLVCLSPKLVWKVLLLIP